MEILDFEESAGNDFFEEVCVARGNGGVEGGAIAGIDSGGVRGSISVGDGVTSGFIVGGVIIAGPVDVNVCDNGVASSVVG